MPARFRRVSRFLAARRGLIVLVCGGPCSGKSALASALAARLNLGAPVHVDALAEALRERVGRGGGETLPSSALSAAEAAAAASAAASARGGDDGCFVGGGPLPSRPPWTTPKARGGEAEEEGETNDGGFDAEKWDREARALRAALSRDLLKAARDGRSTVIEGGGLDPGLFTGVLAAPLARAWEEEEMEEEEEGEESGEEEEEDEDEEHLDRSHDHHHHHRQQRQQRLFRRPPAAGGPPAIVPILVEMEPEHQALLVREACERDPGLAGGAGAAGAAGSEEAIERAVARAAAAVPRPPCSAVAC